MLRPQFTHPARGAYVALEQLIALRFPARQLKLARRKRALNRITGPNKSNFRGRGIDFEEVRNYQPGDDIRGIDWRVTARTGEAHTKLFREERERPVIMVIDQRPAMFFGSRHCFKSVLAAHLASLLSWAALDGGDRIGGLVFNHREHSEIRPRRSRRNVLALLSQIESFNASLPLPQQREDQSFAEMLANLRRIAKPGSDIYLVSDFAGATSEDARRHLFQLSRHAQVTALACHDPLERELPRAGRYAVTDGERRSELDTADQRIRAHYQRSMAAQSATLQQDLQRLGIPLLAASTEHAPLSLLQTYYGEAGR